MKPAAPWVTRVVLLFGVLWGVVVAGPVVGADDPVHSHWLTDDLRIDGVMTDWPAMTFVSKEVSTSVMNDGQDIYVLVATSDPSVNLELRRAGLAIYLDPKGGRGHGFGVRIPPLGSRLEPGNLSLSYFDVLGPGADDMRRVELAEGAGIDLRIGADERTFFLELKVPFVTGAGKLYAPGITLARGEIGLGIVTPEPPRVARPGRGGRGMLSGGGGMGGPPEPKGKSVNLWTKVVLAKAR